MHWTLEGYEYSTEPLPAVAIICRDKEGEEEITVIQNCFETGGQVWDIGAICAACEDAYQEWLSKR